ncbi:hypothetical protein GCM10019059_40860 [Camelimonas fluminis]|uniref:Uncharacterized protein n=1 Tax=Camelimonas fluminis TaxID=1576911 RepID=A0ABV7UC10_9HYPH|nr:hypothetical protein [Camelimonas fluminis]GHE77705.1 hypothetical protein GCM10019059_40860 [Camelimonas fluminis]
MNVASDNNLAATLAAQLTRDAALGQPAHSHHDVGDILEALIGAVRDSERERCARIAESQSTDTVTSELVQRRIAASIRASNAEGQITLSNKLTPFLNDMHPTSNADGAPSVAAGTMSISNASPPSLPASTDLAGQLLIHVAEPLFAIIDRLGRHRATIQVNDQSDVARIAATLLTYAETQPNNQLRIYMNPALTPNTGETPTGDLQWTEGTDFQLAQRSGHAYEITESADGYCLTYNGNALSQSTSDTVLKAEAEVHMRCQLAYPSARGQRQPEFHDLRDTDTMIDRQRALNIARTVGATPEQAAAMASQLEDAFAAVRNEERENCASMIESHMLCGEDGEVLLPRKKNPGNKLGLAYASAIRRGIIPVCPDPGA